MQTKKITTKDGTIMITWENKLHSWDSAALIPQGNKKLAEYYLHGVKYSKKEWDSLRKERTGLPFYKQSGMKVRN